MKKWKSTMARGGGNKTRFQYCTDPSGHEILFLRALQGHSGSNLVDLSLQDNVLIPNDFFEYINHFGCPINVHSIMNLGLIPRGQILGKRQTVFFVCGFYVRTGRLLVGQSDPLFVPTIFVDADTYTFDR